MKKIKFIFNHYTLITTIDNIIDCYSFVVNSKLNYYIAVKDQLLVDIIYDNDTACMNSYKYEDHFVFEGGPDNIPNFKFI